MIKKVQLGDQWYILATASPADERRRVLKYNDTFAIFDRFGDVQCIGMGEEGIYHGDTRFLSHQDLLIAGVRPMFLNSAVKEDNGLFVIELMNPDIPLAGGGRIEKGLLHIFRAKLLWDGACYEHVRVVNFGLEAIETSISMEFGADYADIFEVRGFERNRQGEHFSPAATRNSLVFAYRGADGETRKTQIDFDPEPERIANHRADFRVALAPKEEAHFYATVRCQLDSQPIQAQDETGDYLSVLKQANTVLGKRLNESCKVTTSNPLVNHWIDRSSSDLVMLTSTLPLGRYPYAGVPWYSTTFGRDGILTAWECLWIDPDLAKGVLKILAATQATKEDPTCDAEPGKILHEARQGELAILGEVPFRRYYGTVDATPLFVGLAGAYHERTGDIGFIRSIWPNIRRALDWMDRYGDVDGDGFVEYARRSETGLVQQGWKDSNDSVFHDDGQLADAPIALCEVQGYVYEAKRYAARMATALGESAYADQLQKAAQLLKKNFNEAFWCEAIGTYALALDGKKRQCAVRSSNAGHVLWSGIADPVLAERVAQQLVSEEFFCGWGIRTLSSKEVRYNPMAYHNGSIWPHDNALIAAGMARYGFTAHAMKVFSGLFDVSLFVDQHRLPELFSGFNKRAGEGPTLYPVACSPQAWAAASVFSLLQACLGLSFNPETSEVRFRHPHLPEFIDTLEIRGLTINDAVMDLRLQRYPNNVGINVLRKEGHAEVVVIA
ncbi:amylo-alpha-1,6-glucosidase [Noviherbaspirillum saxi]|uniref:Amylo-alpha-1,6-glucosidase n=1 Tax=Noviherbaspirillum saxi TaxID=2320863 RepID=A0A3A3G007_9BURK|nr:amylo-alpha-1,6-glucosidase [Noviherbaspirillum saxi]RJF99791.1 amylo-alpha-1,6-glucosidase [Noviherbaspirillum saxi]